jgi:hypothetical protein
MEFIPGQVTTCPCCQACPKEEAPCVSQAKILVVSVRAAEAEEGRVQHFNTPHNNPPPPTESIMALRVAPDGKSWTISSTMVDDHMVIPIFVEVAAQ